ncbi:hypothetical protein LPJ70_008023, partial [Coemansia sp. RSA 2708]
VKFHNHYKGPNWGNANTWDNAARSTGVPVNSKPVPGCVAQTNAGSYGHVAWVAKVSGNSVTIEEYNYGRREAYSTRTVPKSSFNYIHVKVPFLAADFEAAAYARQLAGGGTAAAIEEQQAALQAQAAQAAAQQRQAVGRQQTQVLAQVAGVQRLDAELSQVEARVSEMRGAVQGLRARIRVASAQAQGFGRQAQNLQRAQQRVRALARFMQLARRLDAQLAGDEFGLAALTLADVER